MFFVSYFLVFFFFQLNDPFTKKQPSYASPRLFSVLQANLNLLRSKLLNLHYTRRLNRLFQQYDIVVLSETNLMLDINLEAIFPALEWDVTLGPVNISDWGGCLVAVKRSEFSNVTVLHQNDPEDQNSSYEATIMATLNSNGKTLLISGLYYRRRGNLTKRFTMFQQRMDQFHFALQPDAVLVLGYLNLKIIWHEENDYLVPAADRRSYSNKFRLWNMCNDLNLVNVNTQRGDNGQNVLDLSLISRPNVVGPAVRVTGHDIDLDMDAHHVAVAFRVKIANPE